MWTTQEDEIVRKAVMKYGTNQWHRVASLLRRHSAADCRQRWFDFLNPRVSHAPWTPQDDAKLRELAFQMPNMWRSIGASLGRSGDDSYSRFLELTRLGGELEQESAGRSEEENLESPVEDPNELAAANARLSSSMGRKALRKQRERRENEEKFKATVREHRETGKKIAEKAFSRPVIEVPGASPSLEGPTKNQVISGISEGVRARPTKTTKRPKLVLSPPTVNNPTLNSPKPPHDIQQLLSQLPPPKDPRKSLRFLVTDPLLPV